MKDLQEDDILGSVRERLGRYEEAPSEELWEKIAARKDEATPAWPLWVGGASLGMAVVMLFLMTGGGKVASGEVASTVEKSAISQRVQENQTTISSRPENQTTLRESTPAETLSTQPAIIQTLTQSQTQTQPQTSEFESQTPDIRQSADSTTTSPVITPKDSSSTLKTIIPPYKKPKHNLQLFLSFTPSLSFQKIIPHNNDQVIIEGFEHRSPLSLKRFGFGIDAGFQRDINHIFGYYGGLSFYRQHQEITYRYFDSQADVNRIGDSWTFEINRPQQIRTFDYSMTNLGLRSGILVTLKGEKLKHKFGAGLIFSQGVVKSSESYNNSQSTYLSYQLFYRNEVKINERLSWFIEPTLIYSFLSKEKLGEPFSLKPYRAGITAGVLYRF